MTADPAPGPRVRAGRAGAARARPLASPALWARQVLPRRSRAPHGRAVARTKGPKRQFGYPIGIAVVVVVGVLVVLFARNDNQQASAVSPDGGRPLARGVRHLRVRRLPAAPDRPGRATPPACTPTVTASPTSTRSAAASAGKNATLANWGKTTGITFSSKGFTTNGTTYENGYDCNGQPATVSLYVWNADDPSAAPTIVSAADIGSFHVQRGQAGPHPRRRARWHDVPPPPTSVPRPRPARRHDRPGRRWLLRDVVHDRGRDHRLDRHHCRADRPPRLRALREGGGPGRRVRDPPPPADLHDPEADAPDRRPAHDRAGRRRPRAATASPTPSCRSGTDPTPSSTPTPTASAPVSRCTTPSSPSRSTPPAPCASRPPSAGIDDTFVVVNGDVLTDLDVAELWRVPPRPGRRGHHRPHPGRRSLPLRRRAHRRQGTGHRLRREAAARDRPHQLDQRRHLRARAVGARADPDRPQGLHRARDLPRDGRRRHASTPCTATSTGSTPARRTPTSRSSSISSTGSGARPSVAVHPSAEIAPDRGRRPLGRDGRRRGSASTP